MEDCVFEHRDKANYSLLKNVEKARPYYQKLQRQIPNFTKVYELPKKSIHG
jgi:hypothetical protein